MHTDQTSDYQHKILLAEDCPDFQMVFTMLLNNRGVGVTVTENGQECIEHALSANHEGSPFDLVILDIQMPGMSGHVAAQELRKQGYQAPIVALTAQCDPDFERKSLESGCNEHISKLLDRKKILSRVLRYLEKEEKDPLSVPTEPIFPSILQSEPEYGGAVLVFLQRLPATISQIERALDRDDFDSLNLFAINLGSSELFGYELRAKLSAELQQGTAERDLVKVTRTVQKIRQVSDRMFSAKHLIK